MASLLHRPALLLPPALPGAEAVNGSLLGPLTLGIEVTDAALAARCGLGNIDPQHGFGAGRGRAAVEAALQWPLPPDGARLVTLRPDADAFAAMAVLGLRARGAPLDETARARVTLVAECDAFALGGWTSWVAARGPLPTPARAADVSLFPTDFAEAAALAAERPRAPAETLAAFEAWIATGAMAPEPRAAAAAFTERLAKALNTGDISLEETGGVAVVRGARPGGLGLGYRLAPVVVALASADVPRKAAIAQFTPGHLDLAGVREALNRREPGWGGAATILGSPQGRGSALDEASLLAIVRAHLIRPVKKGLDCDAVRTIMLARGD